MKTGIYAVIFKMEELQPYEAIANGETSEKLQRIDELASKYKDVKIQLQYPYCKYIFENQLFNAMDFYSDVKKQKIVDYIDIDEIQEEEVKQWLKQKKNLN